MGIAISFALAQFIARQVLLAILFGMAFADFENRWPTPDSQTLQHPTSTTAMRMERVSCRKQVRTQIGVSIIWSTELIVPTIRVVRDIRRSEGSHHFTSLLPRTSVEVEAKAGKDIDDHILKLLGFSQ